MMDLAKGRAEAAREELQLAVFRVGSEEYAMDIMRIMEIIRPQKVMRIPRAPEVVEGVINLRGRVVAVVDLRKRFGADPEKSDPRKVRVIILRVSGRVVGAVVDEVSEVVYMGAEQVEAAPDAVKGAATEYLMGVGKLGERLIMVLDTDRLLTGEEIRGVKAAEDIARQEAAP